jgi:hypothetical protein
MLAAFSFVELGEIRTGKESGSILYCCSRTMLQHATYYCFVTTGDFVFLS